jgi:hypothetical protein
MSLLNGWGKQVTNLASNTPTKYTVNEEHKSYYANRISISNLGSTRLLARVNLDTPAFTATKDKAIVILPNEYFTFSGDGMPPLFCIVIESVDGLGSFVINAF